MSEDKNKGNTKFVHAKQALERAKTLNQLENDKNKLFEKLDSRLRKLSIRRENYEISQGEAPKALKDSIKNTQDIFDEISSEISTDRTQLLDAIDIAKSAIAELRKVNPKKASELEFQLSLKSKIRNSENLSDTPRKRFRGIKSP
ncbi:hypothetical protein [Vibrio fluvialis]|uniref:hypothetical protein n=1 Tax=Vibrio fluvialis TaxID=676 RepID=UPI0005CAC181|nr:hypothetical protein [Vibrio fluvialis]